MSGLARIVEVDRLDCRLVDHDWAFARRDAERIDAHWAERKRLNPSLYDGVVLLACDVAEKRDNTGSPTLAMDFFETRFSRFLAWRDFGCPDAGVYNGFAMPAVRSADRAFLLGEMGPGHSYAGKLYFPAGTPDLSDVSGGRVDLDGSWRRELEEETGLTAADGAPTPGWTIVFEGQHVACMKIIEAPASADALRARVEKFLANDDQPELSAVHMVSARDQLDDPRVPEFMKAFLATALSR